jgi:tetratricopeptide (TPR) repeat protein
VICVTAFLLSALMYAQSYDSTPRGDDDLRQPARIHPGSPFSGPLLTASGDTPIEDEVLERPTDRPSSGVVSLRELEHPIPKNAIQEAYRAQRLARANNLPKAIGKLEQAIRIDPSYRDAHINLGVLYVRLGRTADARAEFQKALDIGPPIAPLYVDLALASSALGDYPAAETFAHKAQELDSRDATAQRVLDFVNRKALNLTGVTR